MSFLGDTSFREDCWFNFESPMFTLVDPNDIYPIEACQKELICEEINEKNSINQIEDKPFLSINNITEKRDICLPISHSNDHHSSEPNKPISIMNNSKDHTETVIQAFQPTMDLNQIPQTIEYKPITPYYEQKLQLQQQLQLRKAISKQKHDQLKANLDRQPHHIPKIMRKPSGKKMTGRERLLELERQERQQLELRERYTALIHELEQKNNRLREILENIVMTSPEYSTQMINFLDNE